jgi:hypothetical protein
MRPFAFFSPARWQSRRLLSSTVGITALLAFALLVVRPHASVMADSRSRGQSAERPGSVRRAVLVGIDTYVLPGAPAQAATTVESSSSGRPRGAWRDLQGAVNDVDALKEVLVTRFEFKPENVRVLRNAEATREHILDAIRQYLIAPATAGDVSFFFYAGHGSQVRNSKSAEVDQMDESIVPADANSGQLDLRDKELAKIFDEALDKRIDLTAAFDSCHSGSIGRGAPRPTTFRMLAPDMRDAADPSNPTPPAQRGALVLSAARDDKLAEEVQDEGNTPHGLFTWALLKVLRSMPVNQSAERTFQQVHALMQSKEIQEPSFDATPERIRRPLFGTEQAVLSGGTIVAVQSVQPDGTVVLQGGLATGILAGTELRNVAAPKDSPATLQVTEAIGLSSSKAKAINGGTENIEPSTLFQVVRWGAPQGPTLRVWLGATGLPVADVTRHAQRLGALASNPAVTWVDDPTVDPPPAPSAHGKATATPPTGVLRWRGSDWQLSLEGKQTSVGANAAAEAIVPLLALDKPTGKRRVMVSPPLPSEVAANLKLGPGTDNDAIDVLSSPDHADYLLVGRWRANALEYAWVRPLATAQDAKSSALPVRTDWVALGPGGPAALAARLEEQALRLGSIRSWLQLQPPPDEGRFPYHLALKNAGTGDLRTTGPTREGERYGLVLTLDNAALARSGSFDRRYVYVFAIDNAGKGTLLYPRENTGGAGENFLPVLTGDNRTLPQELPLGPREMFSVTPPFGIDTFFMLTTATALADPMVLDWDPVVTRAAARGADDPLSRLLRQTGARTRAVEVAAPKDWSIERLTIESVAKAGSGGAGQ